MWTATIEIHANSCLLELVYENPYSAGLLLVSVWMQPYTGCYLESNKGKLYLVWTFPIVGATGLPIFSLRCQSLVRVAQCSVPACIARQMVAFCVSAGPTFLQCYWIVCLDCYVYYVVCLLSAGEYQDSRWQADTDALSCRMYWETVSRCHGFC